MGCVWCWTENGVWGMRYECFEMVNEFSHSICYKYILYSGKCCYVKCAHIHSSLHLQNNNNTGNTRHSKRLNEKTQLAMEKSYSEIRMRCEFSLFEANTRREEKMYSKSNLKNGRTISWIVVGWIMKNSQQSTVPRMRKPTDWLTELNWTTEHGR